jgi:uncharacterized protein YrzB (UPF0473 family)
MEENNELQQVVLYDENGDEVLFDLVFTFDMEEKHYVILTPSEINEEDDEEIEVYPFLLLTDEDGDYLEPISDDEEFEKVSQVYMEISAQTDEAE